MNKNLNEALCRMCLQGAQVFHFHLTCIIG